MEWNNETNCNNKKTKYAGDKCPPDKKSECESKYKYNTKTDYSRFDTSTCTCKQYATEQGCDGGHGLKTDSTYNKNVTGACMSGTKQEAQTTFGDMCNAINCNTQFSWGTGDGCLKYDINTETCVPTRKWSTELHKNKWQGQQGGHSSSNVWEEAGSGAGHISGVG
jgi:hypothetical protein